MRATAKAIRTTARNTNRSVSGGPLYPYLPVQMRRDGVSKWNIVLRCAKVGQEDDISTHLFESLTAREALMFLIGVGDGVTTQGWMAEKAS